MLQGLTIAEKLLNSQKCGTSKQGSASLPTTIHQIGENKQSKGEQKHEQNTRTNQSFVVNGLELFRQVAEKAEKGNLCGLLIDADKKDVVKGDKLVF